ncbi:hypothetical protein ACJJTC_000223 [Scirpophaga incertulas]
MEQELLNFLLINNLGHLYQPLTDQGADLEFLMAANDHELLTLVPGIINKGKLRIALDQLKESKNKDRNSVVGTKSNELFVATPQRTAIITSSLVTPPVWELQNTQENCSFLNTEPVSQAALVASPSILTWDPQISEVCIDLKVCIH